MFFLQYIVVIYFINNIYNVAMTGFEPPVPLCPGGFYATVMTTNSTETEIAELITSEFTTATEMCVRFW